MRDPDKFFYDIAKRVSEQSRCRSRQTGAVIAQQDHLIAEGWNGAPRGSCVSDCIKCNDKDAGAVMASGLNQELNICVHAEANAIAMAAKLGISTDNATIYTTTFPCSECAKLIISAGIQEVVYDEGYHNTYSDELFNSAKIEVRRYVGIDEQATES